MRSVRKMVCLVVLCSVLTAIAAVECRAAKPVTLTVTVTNKTVYPATFYLYDGHGNLYFQPTTVPAFGSWKPRAFASSSGWVCVWTTAAVNGHRSWQSWHFKSNGTLKLEMVYDAKKKSFIVKKR